MKRIFTYITILFLVGLGQLAWGQTLYKLQVKKNTGGNCGSCNASSSSWAVTGGGTGSGIGPYTAKPSLKITATASYAPFTPNDCVLNCEKTFSLNVCTGTGGQSIGTDFGCMVTPTISSGTCPRDTYDVILFATPDIHLSAGSGKDGAYCASDILTLNTTACLSIDDPTLEWEYGRGASPNIIWTNFATTTTNSASITFGQTGAGYGESVYFRVRYKSHADLGESPEKSMSFNVNAPTVSSASITKINPGCSKSNDGKITITTTTGTANIYKYSLSVDQGGGHFGPYNSEIGNANNANIIFDGLPPGDYKLMVSNDHNNGETADCGSFVPQYFKLTAPPATTLTNTGCSNCSSNTGTTFVTNCAGENGTLSFSIAHGTAPYKYRVYPKNGTAPGFPATSNVTGNTFGITRAASAIPYIIEVTDANNCPQVSYEATITNPPVLIPNIVSITDANCYGVSNGSVTLGASGGVGAYTYSSQASTGFSSNATFSGLGAGTHIFYVRSKGNCTTPINVTIDQPTKITAVIDQIVNPNCAVTASNYSPNGSLRVQPLGGKGGFEVYLKGGTNIIGPVNVAQGAYYTFSNLDANIAYTVEIIEPGACGAANPYTTTLPPLTAPTPPTIGINGVLKANGTNISCNGGSDGVIEVTPANGGNISDFNVEIVSGATQNNIASGSKATFNGLKAGIYTIRATENSAGACIFEHVISLTEPTALTAFIERGAIQTNGLAHISCNGGSDGSITIRPQAGGNGAPYAVTLQNTTGFSITETGLAANASKTFTGLTAGTYTVTIADKNGCATTFTQESTGANAILELTEPAAVSIAAFNTVNVTCLGDTDGTVNVVVAGGNLYTPAGVALKDINNAATVFAAPTQVAANEFRWTGLAPGNYRVTVTDSKGCSLTDASPWTNSSFSIGQPAQALGLSVTTNTPASCYGLSDGSVLVAGTGGWANYVYSADGINYSATPAASFAFSGLAAGTHQFWVKDGLGCVTSIQVTVIEPPVLVPQIDATTHVSCNGGNNGSVTLGATGGWGAASYTYSNASASGFTTNPVFSTLSAGTYTFYVRTNGNCPTPVNVTITEPPVLSASIETSKIRHISCHGANDGAATLNIAGGTAPYKVAANGGALVAGNFIDGLIPGNNALKVEDAQGCIVLLSVVINEPAVLQVNLLQKKETACLAAKGMAQVVGMGGTAPYSYRWYDANNNPLGTNATLSNLSAGSYRAEVQDANGCNAALFVGIATLGAPQIQVTATTAASCDAAGDGSATIQVTSGIAPVTVLWDNGQTSLTATGLTSGLHLVTLTDGDGCATTEEVTIPLAPQMIIQATSQTNPGCFAGCDGSIAVQVSNGMAPYTYSWNVTGQTSDNISKLCAGYYAVTVTDAKGCTATRSFTLTAPAPLTLQIKENKAPACFGGCDGRIATEASGGTAPYTYQWAHGASQTAAVADGLCVGVYSVTITDAKGCTLTKDIRLNEPRELVLSLAESKDPLCHEAATGQITVNVSGGVAPYTYDWSTPGQPGIGNTAGISGVAAGAYTLTVKDANGCEKTATYVLNNPAALAVQLVQAASKDPNCHGSCDGILQVQGQGGTAPYTYSWSNGQTSNQATGLCAGTHNVTITDANGCSLSASYELFDPAPVAISLPETVTLCPGQIYTANAGNAGAKYEWRFGNDFFSNSRVVDLSQEGTYTLTVTNFKGCTASVKLSIISSADALQADFVMLSKGVINDTIAAVNLSFPTPEKVDWKVSGTKAQRELLNYPSPVEQAIVFKETGVYRVTMLIYSGNCVDSLVKTIEIFNTEQEAEGGRQALGHQPEVKIAYSKAYPNPTFGNFKVNVKLSLEGAVTARVRSAQTSGLIATQTKSGDTDYTFDFELQNLPYGIYFVVIETQHQTKTLKVLVH